MLRWLVLSLFFISFINTSATSAAVSLKKPPRTGGTGTGSSGSGCGAWCQAGSAVFGSVTGRAVEVAVEYAARQSLDAAKRELADKEKELFDAQRELEQAKKDAAGCP